VKKKIAKHLYAQNPHATKHDIERFLKDLPIYNNIQSFCKKYFHRSFVVRSTITETTTYHFGMEDEHGVLFSLEELSSGEKSMFGILCAVYGYHLQSGMLIIDEPELHLHPQLQKQFLALLEDISQNLSLQILMTTHSSLMINDKNIKNVYRFHTNDATTTIVNPGPRYSEDAGKLMQILKFTNTAKVFFVKKIIMVE
jgi:putative ATP-dependent endonuclease of the OLD family